MQALISLRQKAGFNQYEASRRCGYCKTAIGHIENGRIELRHTRIEQIVKAYGFKMKDFESELMAELRYGDLLESCLLLIRKLDDQKLHTVYQLLKSFNQ